jgi:hypothetical protein
LTATPTPTAAARKAVAAADPPPKAESIAGKVLQAQDAMVTFKPAISNIYTAILAASVNFGPLVKDAENPFFKGKDGRASKYLSPSALLAAVRPPLTDEGVIITGGYKLIPQGWVVETILYHTPSGTSVSSWFPITDTETVYGPPDQYGKQKQVGANGHQKVGTAGNYGMRYNLFQLLGIAAADDDGNSTSNLIPPDDFLGPAPAGQQRTEPRRLPVNTQPTTPEEDWLR